MAKRAKKKPAASPKGRKLKVYRTPIGFHDAYVAAPSQKAALEAWGIDVNLFARGSAEEVTEPELVKEPLEKPGVVLKRLRGSEKEQLEALGADEAKRARDRAAQERKAAAKHPNKKQRPPKPSRAPLDAAEEALDKLHRAQRKEAAALEKKEKELERERRELERKQAIEIKAAERKRQQARQAYEESLRDWEES